MGRPRKESGSTASPRPAAAPKTSPAAPPPSASAARAPSSRSRSTPVAGRSQEAKPSSSQPKSTAASRGARGDAGEQLGAAGRGSSTSARKTTDAKGASGQAKAEPCPSKAPCRFPAPLESQDITQVEKETRGQRNNPKWYEWRENRITASVAPRIAGSKFANGRTDKVPQSYLKAVVSPGPTVQTPAMSWGIRNEKAAVRAYEQLKSQEVGRPVRVEDCGLFIHKEKTWIAASPDGVVTEADTGKPLGLLEVKCPYKHRNKTVREACKDRDFCLRVDGDSYALKRDHDYFTQVQCQLAAAGLQRADFVVHTKKETAVAPVEFDDEFWGQTVPKLEKFYTEAVIPHLEGEAGGSVWAKEE
uniref:YqaJ viral recombinase domain-containing protein n=1 Tax=Anser brachyrhynchus TaxID=132585 RepID=A0A8B9HXX5_9AVES